MFAVTSSMSSECKRRRHGPENCVHPAFSLSNPPPQLKVKPWLPALLTSPDCCWGWAVSTTDCLCSLRIGSPHRWHLSGSCQSIWCLQLLTPGRKAVWSSWRSRAPAPGRGPHSAPSPPSLHFCKIWKMGIARGPLAHSRHSVNASS